MLAATVGASEKMVLAAERDRTDRTLDDIGVDVDAAVVKEAGKTIPARERVADCVGEPGLLANQSELGLKPRFEAIENGLLFSCRNARRSMRATPGAARS